MSGSRQPAHSIGKWLWPSACALLCLALGTASGLSTVGGDDGWYQELVKPPGTPPSWIFGPIWSVLYRLIVRNAKHAVWVFAIQFALNLIWTPVFFGMREIAVAGAVIGAIWLGLVSTMGLAWKSDQVAAWLLAPYLIWVSYATYLNAGFFWLNR